MNLCLAFESGKDTAISVEAQLKRFMVNNPGVRLSPIEIMNLIGATDGTRIVRFLRDHMPASEGTIESEWVKSPDGKKRWKVYWFERRSV